MTGVEMGDGGLDPLAPDEPPTKDELSQRASLHLQKAQIYAMVTCIPVGLGALNLMQAINDGGTEPLSMFLVCAGVVSAGGFGVLALYSAVKSIHYKIEAQFSA